MLTVSIGMTDNTKCSNSMGRHSPSLVTAIIAVRVPVAEELRGKTHAVAASSLADGTEGLVRVVQRLGHHLLRHQVAVVHLVR